ncbi:hypothetical protein DB346_13340 [Verrucomicrobia bacterium LW23]|nr:hypothetical protein DB346_13340 [Verrucomicrobia bacterium LW23]
MLQYIALLLLALHFQPGASLAQASSTSTSNQKLPGGNRSLNKAEPTAQGTNAPEAPEQAQEKTTKSSTSPEIKDTKDRDKDKEKDRKKPADLPTAANAKASAAAKTPDKDKDKPATPDKGETSDKSEELSSANPTTTTAPGNNAPSSPAAPAGTYSKHSHGGSTATRSPTPPAPASAAPSDSPQTAAPGATAAKPAPRPVTPVIAKERPRKPAQPAAPRKQPTTDLEPASTGTEQEPIGPSLSEIANDDKSTGNTRPYQPASPGEDELLPQPLNNSSMRSSQGPIPIGPDSGDDNFVGPELAPQAGSRKDSATSPDNSASSGGQGEGEIPRERAVKITELEVRNRQLTKDLAYANEQIAILRAKVREKETIHAALGIDALTGDMGAISDRLLKAVAGWYQSEQQRKQGVVLIEKLISTSQSALQSNEGAAASVRAEYEVAVRQAQDYLSGRGRSNVPLADGLSSAQVVDVDKGRGVIIINAGRRIGVREGMPFLIFRNALRIAQVKVFLCYDQVSAALIDSDGQRMDIVVGDTATVATDKNSP